MPPARAPWKWSPSAWWDCHACRCAASRSRCTGGASSAPCTQRCGLPQSCYWTLQAACDVASVEREDGIRLSAEEFGAGIVEQLLTRYEAMPASEQPRNLAFIGRYGAERTRHLATRTQGRAAARGVAFAAPLSNSSWPGLFRPSSFQKCPAAFRTGTARAAPVRPGCGRGRTGCARRASCPGRSPPAARGALPHGRPRPPPGACRPRRW